MTGVFVTGTDTDVGKTMVAAWLARSWGADYWKPIQSGTAEGWDAQVIRQASPNSTIHPSAYVLTQPLSPHEAARRDGTPLALYDLARSAVESGRGEPPFAYLQALAAAQMADIDRAEDKYRAKDKERLALQIEAGDIRAARTETAERFPWGNEPR